MKTSATILAACILAVPATGQVSLRISSGSTLRVEGEIAIVLTGDWENDGIFEAGEGQVTFGGEGEQSIAVGPGRETFYDLAIDKPSGSLTLRDSVSVINKLTMNRGDIATGPNVLQLGRLSAGTLIHTGGTVIGNLARYVDSTTVSYSFPVGTKDRQRALKLDYREAPLSTGVLTVSHVDAGGLSEEIVPLDDEGYTIDRRSEMYWRTRSTGLIGGTFDLAIDAAGQQAILNPALLRLVYSVGNGGFELVALTWPAAAPRRGAPESARASQAIFIWVATR